MQRHPFLCWRSVPDQQALLRLSSDFLRAKEFHGVDGFVVTDEVALSVAAQACLPILHLGLSWYEGFVGIVMHEGPVLARREAVDDSGLVHAWQEEVVGEAVDGGPVMLSWHQGVSAPSIVAPDAPTAFNVVIHEFAHLLDLRDGQLDGAPPLPAERRRIWQTRMAEAFDRFDERRACGYDSIIDPYGAQDTAEFFAVTAEAFFTCPRALSLEQPALYALYTDFFRQDPAPHSREATAG